MAERILKTGLFVGKVVAINPTKEQVDELFGTDSKWRTEYIGKTKDGEDKVNFDIWLQPVNTRDYFHLKFSLINKKRTTASGNQQWINDQGATTWGRTREDIENNDSPMGLQFKAYPYREALVGEETLYDFLRKWSWQGKKPEDGASLLVPSNNFFQGDYSTLQALIPLEANNTVLAMATVQTTSEGKEYQNVYKTVAPGWYEKEVLQGEPTGYIAKWVNDLKDPQYGTKDAYKLAPLSAYSSQPNSPSKPEPTNILPF